MMTAIQLQIVQSPITSLISTVPTSVTVKLDESNYLTWHFQMQLLLEGHGIMGFLDGSLPCPARFMSSGSGESDIDSGDSSSRTDTDEYKVWKMHDRTLMQLITVTLSPSAVSCVIARDYLTVTGVHFEDDDIVILTLNGLSGEYNTIRSIIRGRESVISLKDLRSQLLAEGAMVEKIAVTPFLSAMVAKNSESGSKNSSFSSNGYTGGPNQGSPANSSQGYSSTQSSGFSGATTPPIYFKNNYNKHKARGKFNYNTNSRSGNFRNVYTPSASGILGASPSQSACQICGKLGHLADTCRFRNTEVVIVEGCQICGKKNHTAQFCHFRNANISGTTPQMTAMHVNSSLSTPTSNASSQHFWLTDSGATNHLTTIQTVNGAGLSISHTSSSVIHTPTQNLKLNSVLYVPRITQNLLSVHRICLDNNCWLIFLCFLFLDSGQSHREDSVQGEV
ncbi:hypothetical protein D8674_018513 [Pyrus ussuriensis x Pyrus communis]|uniref:CCHC-type domain-containing protein n=1 Tax=Pyrus ussuriensis x Pyrus communis TaxID=2448454 RepID=A0A5N5G9U4_9ROSA|nr:hypothetical protein D8674_018513 [Pyrus ussuriensis x Pyrus communis]